MKKLRLVCGLYSAVAPFFQNFQWESGLPIQLSVKFCTLVLSPVFCLFVFVFVCLFLLFCFCFVLFAFFFYLPEC